MVVCMQADNFLIIEKFFLHVAGPQGSANGQNSRSESCSQ